MEGIKKRGVSGIHIAMVPNGCDLDIFTESATPWRPQGVAGSDLMAVFAGTHGIANGLDIELTPLEDSAGHRQIGLVWRKTSVRGDEFRRLGELLASDKRCVSSGAT